MILINSQKMFLHCAFNGRNLLINAGKLLLFYLLEISNSRHRAGIENLLLIN